jgi:hypothetical protein
MGKEQLSSSEAALQKALAAVAKLEEASRNDKYLEETQSSLMSCAKDVRSEIRQLADSDLQVRNLKKISIQIGTTMKTVVSRIVDFASYLEAKNEKDFKLIASALKEGDMILSTSLVGNLPTRYFDIKEMHTITLQRINHLEQSLSGLLIGEVSLFNEKTKTVGIAQGQNGIISATFRPAEAIARIEEGINLSTVLHECMIGNAYNLLVNSVDHALKQAEERTINILPGLNEKSLFDFNTDTDTKKSLFNTDTDTKKSLFDTDAENNWNMGLKK